VCKRKESSGVLKYLVKAPEQEMGTDNKDVPNYIISIIMNEIF